MTNPGCFKDNSGISLFWLVFLTLKFSLPVYFLQLTQYVSIVFYIVYSTEVLGFFISSFISCYSLYKLFTEINSSRLTYEQIKTLEIRTSKVSNLSFPNNTNLSCFFPFFIITDLHSLIPALIAQIFVTTAELAITTGIAINEANAEIETQPVTVEFKISKCST